MKVESAENSSFDNFAGGFDRVASLKALQLENTPLLKKPARIHIPYFERFAAPRKDFSATIPSQAKSWYDLALESLDLLQKMDAAMLAPCGVEFVQADDGATEAWLIYEIK